LEPAAPHAESDRANNAVQRQRMNIWLLHRFLPNIKPRRICTCESQGRLRSPGLLVGPACSPGRHASYGDYQTTS
jgi:hypothetical protein